MRRKMTEAQRELAESNMKLVYWYISRHNLEFDEWVGPLMETLCLATMTFDERRSMEFSTYAIVAFDHCVGMQKRKDCAAKTIPTHLLRSGDQEAVSFDNGRTCTLFEMVEDGRDSISDMLFMVDFRKFIDGLSEDERILLALKLDGKKQWEIGKELGISQPVVSRIEKKLKERMLKECFMN